MSCIQNRTFAIRRYYVNGGDWFCNYEKRFNEFPLERCKLIVNRAGRCELYNPDLCRSKYGDEKAIKYFWSLTLKELNWI